MKILLIMPLSYGYYKAIKDVLVARGDEVSFIPDFDESYFKRLLRKFKSIKDVQNKYIQSEINKLADATYDVVLLIRGYCYNYSTVEWIKAKYNRARFVLYQWDPLSISKFDVKALPMFDKLFSFDKSDSIKYSMTYMPLFFSKITPPIRVCRRQQLHPMISPLLGQAIRSDCM